MIRTDYQPNAVTEDPNDVEIFGDEGEDLRGFQERRGGLEIQWARFFDFSVAQKPQLSRKLDAKIAVGLGSLPFITDLFKSLAQRNLLRGKALGLPLGPGGRTS
jgi:hypothetical protein